MACLLQDTLYSYFGSAVDWILGFWIHRCWRCNRWRFDDRTTCGRPSLCSILYQYAYAVPWGDAADRSIVYADCPRPVFIILCPTGSRHVHGALECDASLMRPEGLPLQLQPKTAAAASASGLRVMVAAVRRLRRSVRLLILHVIFNAPAPFCVT